MANAMYGTGKEYCLGGLLPQVNIVRDVDVYVALLTAAYTFDVAHSFYSTVLPYVVGAPARMQGRALQYGKFIADPLTFFGIAGLPVASFVIWKSSGSAASSPLIAFYDDVTGLVYQPVGNDAVLSFDSTGVFNWLG